MEKESRFTELTCLRKLSLCSWEENPRFFDFTEKNTKAKNIWFYREKSMNCIFFIQGLASYSLNLLSSPKSDIFGFMSLSNNYWQLLLSIDFGSCLHRINLSQLITFLSQKKSILSKLLQNNNIMRLLWIKTLCCHRFSLETSPNVESFN